MTVIDTSGVVDLLLGAGVARHVLSPLEAEGELAAPEPLATKDEPFARAIATHTRARVLALR